MSEAVIRLRHAGRQAVSRPYPGKPRSRAGGERATLCASPAAGGETPSAYGANAATGTRYLMNGSLVQCIEKHCEMADIKQEPLKPDKNTKLAEY